MADHTYTLKLVNLPIDPKIKKAIDENFIL